MKKIMIICSIFSLLHGSLIHTMDLEKESDKDNKLGFVSQSSSTVKYYPSHGIFHECIPVSIHVRGNPSQKYKDEVRNFRKKLEIQLKSLSDKETGPTISPFGIVTRGGKKVFSYKFNVTEGIGDISPEVKAILKQIEKNTQRERRDIELDIAPPEKT